MVLYISGCAPYQPSMVSTTARWQDGDFKQADAPKIHAPQVVFSALAASLAFALTNDATPL